MFGTLEMPEADQVGRRLSALGTTVVSVDYTLAPLDALDGARSARARRRVPVARADPRRDRRPPAPGRGSRSRTCRSSPRSTGPSRTPAPTARTPTRVSLGGASAGANLSAGAAMRLRDRGTTAPRVLALVYPSLHDGILTPNAETAELLRDVPPARLFTPESRDAINRNYLPDGARPRTATRSRAATTSRVCPRC